MKAEQETTHFCDDQKNKVFSIVNIKDKTALRFEVPYYTDYLFDSVQVGNQIYFTGGGLIATETKGEQFFQTAMKLTISPDLEVESQSLPNMGVSRANHTMVALTNNLLYVVGGCNSKAEIPACEEYDVLKKKWTLIPSLNEKKMWPSVIGIENRYLYSFGGSTNFSPKESNMIEMLDITDKTAKLWTKVELAGGKDVFPRCFFLGISQASDSEILLFGGLVDQQEISDSFIFNFKSKVMAKGAPLKKPDAFYRSKVGTAGGEKIVVGSSEGDLHVYNMAAKQWNLIKKDTWNPEVGFSIKSDTL